MYKFLLAGYPCLYVTTLEPDRAVRSFAQQIIAANQEPDEEKPQEDTDEQQNETPSTQRPLKVALYEWDIVEGMRNIIDNRAQVDREVSMNMGGTATNLPSTHPLYPLQFLTSEDRDQATVVFVHNYHLFMAPQNPMYANILQKIQNDHELWKAHGKTIVVVSPHYQTPSEIDRLFQLMDFGLPDEAEIVDIMKNILPDEFVNPEYDPALGDANEESQFSVDFNEHAINASKGMTSLEIENALSLSLYETWKEDDPKFDPIIISEIKQQQIKKSATLEISPATHKFNDVVGMQRIKPYLLKSAPHLLAQGPLIVGVPGCGKTYIGEALGNELGLPTIIVSFERIMAAGGGIVGQSQNQAIQTFKVIDAMSPAILVIDELEKGLAGVQTSGRSDGGSKAGVGSVFLKWIEKKTPGIYTIATCNSIDDLPPEYKRPGRWDAIWGVDLPVQQEIVSNLEYYITKYLEERHLEEEHADELFEMLEDNEFVDGLVGYSHAELMTMARHCAILGCSLLESMEYVKPIFKIDEVAIQSIRSYMSNNAIMASDTYLGKPKALRPKAKDLKIKRRIRKPRKRISK